MAGNNHLIQKVTFEIGLPSQEGAYQLQNRISEVFKSTLLQAVEPLFDKCAGRDVILSIDRLELDLGNIRSDMLEEELQQEFLRQINDFLSQAVTEIKEEEMHASTQSSSVNVRVQHRSRNNIKSFVHVAKSEVSLSVLDKVIYLLRYGTLPASTQEYTRTRLAGIMDEVLALRSTAFAVRLSEITDSNAVLQRLVLNLPASKLQYILALLGCPFSGELQRVIESIIQFTERILKVDPRDLLPRGVHFSKQEQAVWWYVLRHYQRSMRSPETAALVQPVQLVTLVLSELLAVHMTENTAAHHAPVSSELQSALNAVAAEVLKDPVAPSLQRSIRKVKEMLSAAPSGVSIKTEKKPEAVAAPAIFQAIENQQHANPPEELTETEPAYYIRNAGLIICAPYLHHFFLRCGLLDKSVFQNTEAAWKAVHLLQYLCGQWPDQTSELEQNWNESDLLFNKILCGIPINEVVPETMVLTDSDREEAEALLSSIRTHWTIMRNSSVHALQSTFLQKEGRLMPQGDNWDLLIERDSAVEILIDKLPWSISLVKLPWNDYTVHTQW